MAQPWTLERLEKLAPRERWNLYENAIRLDTPDARDLIRAIDESGLALREGGGLPGNHPVIRKISAVTATEEARTAASAAAEVGEPAMAGVDPILKREVGKEYGTLDTTSWAGTFVAREMYLMGFKSTKQAKLPAGLVAKTAMCFVPRK